MDNVLIAREGYIYTNGETYAHTIRLGVNDSVDNWYEITESDYEEILKEQDENASLEEEQRGGLLL